MTGELNAPLTESESFPVVSCVDVMKGAKGGQAHESTRLQPANCFLVVFKEDQLPLS